ncbi:hypothetical protein GS397_20690 [Sphingobium yanoikuyae]|uniref:Uncharacterized protein n=1 Tax=Sphingobium yanoikuyae TaxID=13690 RepID=A0A6P1GL78_SPHYA|nr:hypothetical protein [Sphingobium yanoikuyae]QHD69229.1 hypothetical protein GS397_20690 [Sphingobium yanoikuyae]
MMRRSIALCMTALSLALVATAGTGADAQPGSTPVAAAEDPLFTQPYIDIDEWRDAPVRHRYVPGGFKGTETRFSA